MSWQKNSGGSKLLSHGKVGDKTSLCKPYYLGCLVRVSSSVYPLDRRGYHGSRINPTSSEPVSDRGHSPAASSPRQRGQCFVWLRLMGTSEVAPLRRASAAHGGQPPHGGVQVAYHTLCRCGFSLSAQDLSLDLGADRFGRKNVKTTITCGFCLYSLRAFIVSPHLDNYRGR